MAIAIIPYGVTGVEYDSPIGTIPKAVALTGTVAVATTSPLLTGTTTVFDTTGGNRLRPGDTIYFIVTATLTFFTVMRIIDNTHLVLDRAPAANVVGATAYFTRPKYRSVSIKNIGAGNALVNGAKVEPQDIVLFSQKLGQNPLIVPVIQYDVSAGELAITANV